MQKKLCFRFSHKPLKKMTLPVTWPPPDSILLGSKEDTVVLVLEHGARVLTIGGCHVLLLIDKTEPHFLNHSSYCAVGRLDAVFTPLVREVVEQRTKVDPGTPFLQYAVDHLDELNDVVSAVDEEGGDNGVLARQVLGLAVHLNKVAGSHREPGILWKLAGVDIREVDCYKLIAALNVVAVIVKVRVDLETVNS